jgi:carboxyl-terminal processing protease
LTTARYFTPSGRSIQATGIVPDIVLEQGAVLAKAEKKGDGPIVREANLPRHLERKKGKESPERKGEPESGGEPHGDDVPANVKEGEIGSDPQLDHALELLKSWQVFKTFVARREG